MKEPQQISWWQLTTLIVAVKISMLMTYAPIVASGPSTAREAWLAAPLAALPALGMGLLVYFLCTRFPGLSVFAYAELILGRVLGTAFNLLLVLLFLHWAGISLRMFSEFIVATALRTTPQPVIAAMMALLASRGVAGGLRLLARTSEILVPGIVAITLLTMAALLRDAFFENLLPFLGDGIGPVLRQALTPIGVFGEMSWVALLGLPYLSRLEDGPRALAAGTAINALLVGSGAALLMALFGKNFIPLLTFPSFHAIRVLRIGGVLERVEWIFSTFWIGLMYLKFSVLLFGAAAGAGRVLRLKDYRPAVLPAAALAVAWSIFAFDNHTQLLEFFRPRAYLLHSLPLELGAPLLLLVLSLALNRRAQPL